jgi:hypothetical protein
MAERTYHILFKNGRTTEVAGVESETIVHEENHTGRNYRDDMDLMLVARAQLSVGAGAYVIASDTTATVPSPEPVSSLTDASSKAPGIMKTGNYTFYSISDRAAKIPPRHELNKRSRLKLWSDAAGGGDCLFAGFLDQIVAYSIGEFGRA